MWHQASQVVERHIQHVAPPGPGGPGGELVAAGCLRRSRMPGTAANAAEGSDAAMMEAWMPKLPPLAAGSA
jgi:hypothetical protein